MKITLLLLKNELIKLFAVSLKFKVRGIGLIGLFALGISLLSTYYGIMLIKTASLSNAYLILYFLGIVTYCVVIFSSLSTIGYLFGASDFDLLMALPIKKETIMFSKMAGFILIQIFYCFFISVPIYIIYGNYTNADIMFYLLSVLGCPFTIITPCFIAFIIGITVKKLSGKSKYNQLIKALLSILLITAVFITSLFVNNANIAYFIERIVDNSKVFLPLIHLYVYGIMNTEMIYWLLAVLCNIILLFLLVYLFANVFVKLNLDNNVGYKVNNFKLANSSLDNIKVLLIKKEFNRFFTNIPYMVNLGSGIIMSIIGVGYIVINGQATINLIKELLKLNDIGDSICHLSMFALGLSAQMNCISCVSVSLEGKNFWLLKSLPVKAVDIFFAKVFVNFIIVCVPGLICYYIIALLFAFNWLWYLWGALYFILLGLFVGMIGLIFNLHFPKLHYDQEIKVIKQSLSSFLGVYTNMILGLGTMMAVISMPYINALNFTLIIICIYFLFDLLMYLYLHNNGIKLFNKL